MNLEEIVYTPPRRESLPERFRFHTEHGGYATPPGPAACAWRSAENERAAVAAGYVLVIQPDPEGTCTGEHPAWGAILYGEGPDGENEAITSLWGIDDEPGAPYYRTVYADLAGEIEDVILSGPRR